MTVILYHEEARLRKKLVLWTVEQRDGILFYWPPNQHRFVLTQLFSWSWLNQKKKTLLPSKLRPREDTCISENFALCLMQNIIQHRTSITRAVHRHVGCRVKHSLLSPCWEILQIVMWEINSPGTEAIGWSFQFSPVKEV